MSVTTKARLFVCIEAFAATLVAGDAWFKVGQRVPADHEVFKGESGKNRQSRLFTPAEEGE